MQPPVTPQPSNNSGSKGLVIILALLGVIALTSIVGVGAYLLGKSQGTKTVSQSETSESEKEVTQTDTTETDSITTTNNTDEDSTSPTTTSSQSEKGEITGLLGYPSEALPAMTVCAVDTTTKQETCKNHDPNTTSYTLEVAPGTYFVYGNVEGLKSYYTNCDSSEKPTVCNNQDWRSAGFECHLDTACREAFLPVKVTVNASQVVENITILQGWYIPYSDSVCPPNEACSETWDLYLEWD